MWHLGYNGASAWRIYHVNEALIGGVIQVVIARAGSNIIIESIDNSAINTLNYGNIKKRHY